jgi:integrase
MNHPTLDQSQSYPTSIPFETIAEEYLKANVERWSGEWFERNEKQLNRFIAFLNGRQITPVILQEWEEHRTAIGGADYQTTKVVSYAYKFAIRKGWAARSPFREFRARPIPKARKIVRTLIPHDYWERIAKIACKAGIQWYPIWVGCYETGMAAADVMTLKWAHIDKNTWVINRIRRKMEKREAGGKFTTAIDPSGRFYHCVLKQWKRLLALGDEATEADRKYVFPHLFERFENDPARQIRALWQFFKNHNLPAFRFHDLRMARITNMVNAKTPMHIVRQVAGHSTANMVHRYIATDQSLVADEVIRSNRASQCHPLQSPSGPTAPPISCASTSEPVETFSAVKSPSSSPMTDQTYRQKLREFLTKKVQPLVEATAADPTALETGKPTLEDAYGAEPVELTSPSS